MRIDSWINGPRYMKVDSIPGMLLDRARHILIPRIVVSRKDYDIQAEEGRLFETKTPWQHGVSETTLEEITPEMALEKSQEILRRLKHMPELSVGDLSGLKSDRRGLLELYVHPKDGRSLLELYEGNMPEWPPVSESEEMRRESQRKQNEKKQEVLRIQRIIDEQRREADIRHEFAKRGHTL